ncbi:MAG TPA: hypothetical protein VGC78_03965 [Gaiellaceae bacterium]
MFGRKQGVTKAVGSGADAVVEFVDPLVQDEKLRKRLVAALAAGTAARQRVRRQTGLRGLATRLATDPVLRVQLAELATQLGAARKRVERKRSHKLRTTILVLAGAGAAAGAVAVIRSKRDAGDEWSPDVDGPEAD